MAKLGWLLSTTIEFAVSTGAEDVGGWLTEDDEDAGGWLTEDDEDESGRGTFVGGGTVLREIGEHPATRDRTIVAMTTGRILILILILLE
jgi:hypothetical protein